jgi:cytochrome c oxidase subunit 2
MGATVAPANALEIQVVARRWRWQFEYPDGTRTINDLHLPVGKPVRLLMSSEDVIHSFFVPSFRVKKDVVPNMYTELTFTPRSEGEHIIFCAEYCGTGHSAMFGKVIVTSEDAFREWQEQGDEASRSMPLEELGALLYQSRGCNVCHSIDGTRRDGPTFQGVFGETQTMTDGSVVTVDENYLRESILDPQAKVLSGYQAIMPTFQGLLREREIQALIAFIKAQE